MKLCHSRWREFEVESQLGLSPSRGWVPRGLSPSRDWVHSGWSPFGVEALQGWVHSGLSPFRVESIRGWVPSGRGWVHLVLSPFRVESIRGWVPSGLSLSRFSHSRFSRWIFYSDLIYMIYVCMRCWSRYENFWIVGKNLLEVRIFKC